MGRWMDGCNRMLSYGIVSQRCWVIRLWFLGVFIYFGTYSVCLSVRPSACLFASNICLSFRFDLDICPSHLSYDLQQRVIDKNLCCSTTTTTTKLYKMQKICILILFKCQFKFIFICRDLFIVYAEVERSLNCIEMDCIIECILQKFCQYNSL